MKVSRHVVIGVSSALTCIAILCIMFLTRTREQMGMEVDTMPPAPQILPPPPPPETTTSAPVTAPDYDEPDLQNIRVGGMTVLYPRVPLMEFQYNPRRWELVPGAIIPGMQGRRIADATHVISTTYPGVTVRVVSHTDPLNLEVRRDRVTLTVDLYTKRVITARIG